MSDIRLLIMLYNLGYRDGHYDTVDGSYVRINECDMDSYHSEDVREMVADIGDTDE